MNFGYPIVRPIVSEFTGDVRREMNKAYMSLNHAGIWSNAGATTRWLNTHFTRNQSCYFNGSAYISTPDSGALALTGDVQTWTLYGVKPASFAAGVEQALASQWNSATDKGWILVINTTGRLKLYVSVNGSANIDLTSIDVIPTSYESIDLRFSRVVSTGVILLETAPSGGAFSTLYTGTAASGALYNPITGLLIGGYRSSGTFGLPFTGYIQKFTLHDDDRLAASWDARDQDDYGSSTLTNTFHERLENRDFSNGITGWEEARSVSTLTAIGGRLRIAGDGTNTMGASYQVTGLVTGSSYAYTATVDIGTASSGVIRVRAAETEDLGTGYIAESQGPTGTSITRTVTFIAQSSIMYVGTIITGHTAGQYVELHNISVVESPVTYTSTGAIYRDKYDVDAVIGTAANLRAHDSGAMLLDGASGSFASAPDSPAASVTGDCVLFGYVQPSDNTPTAFNTIVGKYNFTGDQRAYIFNIDNSSIAGALSVYTSSDGSVGRQEEISSTVASPYADGVGYWAFAVVDIGTNITFYTSTSPPSVTVAAAFAAATILGTAVTMNNASIFDSTALVEIGAFNAGTGFPFNGQIHRGGIINGILPQGLEFSQELITNGNFSNGLTGWVNTGGVASASVVSGVILVSSGQSASYFTQSFDTIVGVEYIMTGDIVDASGALAFYGIRKADNIGASTNVVTVGNSQGKHSQTFTATATTTYAVLQVNNDGAFVTFDNISVKPTAAIAVDFNPALAGRSATGVDGDSWFGAEMLKSSARTINANDWASSGTGSITDNGDGTVTLDDQDLDASQYQLSLTATASTTNSAPHQFKIILSQGTAATTVIQAKYTGVASYYPVITISWADPLNPSTASGATVSVLDLGSGQYEYTCITTNNAAGNTTLIWWLYPAGSAGGAVIQNSG